MVCSRESDTLTHRGRYATATNAGQRTRAKKKEVVEARADMRGALDRWLEGLILMEDGKQTPDDFSDLADWGLWYNTPAEIEYTRRCWELLHYHKRLPDDGGLAEQDAYRMDDVMMIERVYRYHHRRLYIDGAIGDEPALPTR